MTATLACPDSRLIKAETETLIWSEPLPGGRVVVKLYRHRAFHDPLRRWLLPYRVEREFRMLELLCRCGVACPEPIRWSHGRDRIHGRHELLVTREIAPAGPLDQLLNALNGSGLPDLTPLFELARRMHECGVAHGAFYPRNILVAQAPGSPPQFYVMDLARSRRFSGNLVGTRPADYDLLDMLSRIPPHAVAQHGDQWLAAYGLPVARRRRLLDRLGTYRNDKPWRDLRHIETDARLTLDRVRHGA